jgi:3-phenylpropionate/trans-cinnamate dioxygenase ferredoxin subunit
MPDSYQRAAGVDEIALNQSKAFRFGDRDILLCNTKDGFFAVENQCSHQLQALEGGRIRGCYIFCPLHGQRFNLKDGAPIGQLTDKPIRTFETRIDGNAVFIRAPLDGGEQD